MDIRNNVQLWGNLGKDPEVKNFESGNKVCRLSLATNESYKNSKGEVINATQWHSLVAWGKKAELFEKYLHKGDELAIVGKLTYREFEDKDGIKRSITEVEVESFRFVNTTDQERAKNLDVVIED